MSLLERVRAIRDAYYNEYRDRRNLFEDKRGRQFDQPSANIGAGAICPRPRVRRGVWRRGVAGDDEDADEGGDSEQEDSSGDESDESEEDSSEDDEDGFDADGSAVGNRQRDTTTIPNQPEGFSSRPRHYPPFHLPSNPTSHPSMTGHQQRSYERWIPPQETMRQTNRSPVTAKTSKAVDRRYDIWLPPNMASHQSEKGKPPTI